MVTKTNQDRAERTAPVRVLVTDLDNTLFDWVSMWYAPFTARLRTLMELTGATREDLTNAFRAIHQRHGTSEYRFALDELPYLEGIPHSQEIRDAVRSAEAAATRGLYRTYPGVRSTLRTIKSQGAIIIGYTESMPIYTLGRLAKLQLDGLLDYVFTPPNHPISDVQFSPVTLKQTQHRVTPQGELKPQPRLLLDIVKSVSARPSDAVYVGDSLMKDVAMAQQAGITDVWAQYGVAQYRSEYELLRAVTHWTPAGVEREKHFFAPRPPSVVLKRSFSELLKLFTFATARQPASTISP